MHIYRFSVWSLLCIVLCLSSVLADYQMTSVSNNGYLYTSNNTGINWTIRASQEGYRSVAMDDLGIRQIAGIGTGALYLSNNSGVNWTYVSFNEGVSAVASSGNGSYLLALGKDEETGTGSAYRSNDSGATWILTALNGELFGAAISSSGQYQTIVLNSALISVSSNYGITFANKGVSAPYRSVSMSESGEYQTAVAYNGRIYRSTDYGQTWTNVTSSNEYHAFVSMSANGSRQLIAQNTGFLQLSLDYGLTWNNTGQNRSWYGVGMSGNGQVAIACGFNTAQQLYISNDGAINFTPTGPFDFWRACTIAKNETPTSTPPLAFTLTQPSANTQTNTTLQLAWTNASNNSAVSYNIRQLFTTNGSFVRSIVNLTNGSLDYLWTLPASVSQNYTVEIRATNAFGVQQANSTTFVIDTTPPLCVNGSPILANGFTQYQINMSDDYQLRNYTYSCTDMSSGSSPLGFVGSTFVVRNISISQNTSCTYIVQDWLWNTSCTQLFIFNSSTPPTPPPNNTTYVFSLASGTCQLISTTLLDYRLIILFVILVLSYFLYKVTASVFVLIPTYGVVIYIFVGLYYCDTVIAFIFMVMNIVASIALTEWKRRR